MKVLINVPDLDRVGGVAQIYKVLQLEDDANIDYFIIHNKNEKSKIDKLKRLFTKYIDFFQTCRNYDLIHFNPSFLKKAFLRDSLFVILAKMRGKKVLVYWHGWEQDFEDVVKKSRFYSFLFRKSFGKADAFIILGEIFRHKLIALGVDPHTHFFVETTIADDTKFSEVETKLLEKNISEKDVHLLFLSRIVKEKGIYITLDAVNILQKDSNMKKTIHLHIAGDGDVLDDVKEYAKKIGVDNVMFYGHISGNQKYELLTKSHIFVFPSYYGEGLPVSILEAMLYGMPIISRINAGIPDQVKNGENGYLTESIDPKNFADLIKHLLVSEEEYKRISLNNIRKAKENYIKEKVKSRLLNIYSVIGQE